MINEGLDLSRAEVSSIRTDLDTVRLGVEGPAVVELQDDERQSIRLPHLLVVIQRWPLVKGAWVFSAEDDQSYRLYLNLTVEGVVCAYFPQSRFGHGVQSDNKMNNWSDLINNACCCWSWPHIHSGLLNIQELRNFPLFLAQRAEVFEGVRHKPEVRWEYELRLQRQGTVIVIPQAAGSEGEIEN